MKGHEVRKAIGSWMTHRRACSSSDASSDEKGSLGVLHVKALWSRTLKKQSGQSSDSTSRRRLGQGQHVDLWDSQAGAAGNVRVSCTGRIRRLNNLSSGSLSAMAV